MPASVFLAGAMMIPALLATGCAASTGTPAAAGASTSMGTVGGNSPSTAPASGAADPAATASGLPGSVWVSPAQIPLDSSYHWQSPSGLAQGGNLVFQFEDLCETSIPASVGALDGQFTTATATMTGNASSSGNNDWVAKETITHDPSVDSGSDQVAFGAFTDLVASLKTCAQSQGVHMTVTTDSGENFAATATIPTSTGATLTVHDYVTVPDGTLVELALWAAPYAGNSVSVPWAKVSDASVLSAISSPVCGTYHDC